MSFIHVEHLKQLMGEKNEVEFDIVGSCVSRDIIGIDDYPATVNNYFQTSFIPMVLDTPFELQEISCEELSFRDKPNYSIRMAHNEINHTMLRKLEQSDSDWVMIDIRPLTYGYYRFRFDGLTWLYTDLLSLHTEDISALFEKSGCVINEFDKVLSENLPITRLCIESFCKFLKNRYSKNIVFVEVEEAVKRQNADNQIVSDVDYQSIRDLNLEKTFNKIIMDSLKCHVIRMPGNITSDPLHKWGPSRVHYVDDYYRYARDCLDIILHMNGNKELLDRRFSNVCDHLQHFN